MPAQNMACGPQSFSCGHHKFSIVEIVAKVRLWIINNRTNFNLVASYWGICLLSYFCDD